MAVMSSLVRPVKAGWLRKSWKCRRKASVAFYHVGKQREGATVVSHDRNVQMRHRYGGLLACGGGCEELLWSA